MATKKTNNKKASQKDNRLMVLGIIAIVVVLAFTAIYFINKSSNEAKIENSTSASNQKTSDEASNTSNASKLYGDYTPQYQATIDLLDDPNYQNIISPEDADEKVKSSEGAYLYFFSPTCSHCKKVTPELMPLAEKANVEIDQYNVLEFAQGWDDYAIDGTPTLAYFKDGKEMGRLVGEQPADAFNEFFEAMENTK